MLLIGKEMKFMVERLVLSFVCFSLLLTLAGCSMEPLRIDALNMLNAAPQSGEMKKLKLGVVYTENTKNALRYLVEMKGAAGPMSGQIDPDDAGLEKWLREIFGTMFGEVTFVSSFQEAHAKNAHLVAIVDMYADIGYISFQSTTFDMSVDFRRLDGESIAIVKGSGKRRVPYPAYTPNWRPAVKEALEIFTTALAATPALPGFAANNALIATAASPATGAVSAAPAVATIKSDVDDLPAIKAKPNKNAYAIVIGIEQYRQDLPKADFAVHDARTVTEYLTKALGFPENNVITLLNDRALKSDFEKYFERWLFNNVDKDSTVFVYYSGLGAPNPKTADAFLVPYDGDPAFIDQTGYSLKRLYENLNKLKAGEIIVALDSSFSGAGGKSVMAKGARPLVISMDKAMVNSSKIAILSAASGEQISSAYSDKGHGLFTYFMLKGIKEGSTDLEDLYAYLKPQVERIARKELNREQKPLLIADKNFFLVKK